jgi:outer membrane immunogenic protein
MKWWNKWLIAAGAFGFPATVLAADMAIKAPLAPRVAAYDGWAGFYLGFDGGFNLGSFSPIFGRGVTATEVNLDDNSAFVGGHIAYLGQSGSFVFGVEGGVQWLGFKSQAELAPAVGITPAILLQQKIDWLAYANVRAGITPFARTLLYVTGGVAWAHVKGEFINLAALDTSAEQSVTGWNLGLGIEFKITDNLTFGGEYRHYDFGKVQAANPALTLMLGGVDTLTVDQAMARLSYRIN